MSVHFKFAKMHGLGNDFVVVNNMSSMLDIKKIPIKTLGNRHLGIGFDQLLLIERSDIADFSCRIFNSDGSEAEQCGNGMRCIGRFIQEKKLSDKKTLSIETHAGVITIVLHDFDHIAVKMGKPIIEPACEIKIDDQSFSLCIISMGNPHAILKVNSIQAFPVSDVGKKISTHHFFPEETNVGFMEIINPHHIRLQTFERGAGLTLACGSNACAAVVSGIVEQLLEHKVKVELPLGDLWVEWDGNTQSVIMTGPAKTVFQGEIFFD